MSADSTSIVKIANFLVLPLKIEGPSLSSTTQWIYLQPHNPKHPDADSSRSLFLINVPADSTDLHFRSLFTEQLGGGRVESVRFEDFKPSHKSHFSLKQPKSGKRKSAISSANDAEVDLSSSSEPNLRHVGSTAVVVFVDRASMELSYKAAQRAVKDGSNISWTKCVAATSAKLGADRYREIHRQMFPLPQDLSTKVDAYMASVAEAEAARAKALARERQVPDEDGFITVTRGGRTGPARSLQPQDKLGKQNKRSGSKNNGLQDFYRFQLRERRKDEAGSLKRRFEEDRRKVEEMRAGKKSRFFPL